MDSGLIPVRGLHRVARSAQEEMLQLINDPDNADFDFTIAINELNQDINRANEIMVKRGSDAIPLIQ